MTIAGVDGQGFEPGPILHQRDPGFNEKLGDIDRAGYGFGWTALTGAITRPVSQVRIKVHSLVPVLASKDDLYALLRHGTGDPVAGQVTGYEGNVLILFQAARSAQGNPQVVERLLRHAARLKDVPGHTTGIAAVDHGAAGGRAGDLRPAPG